VFSPSSWKPDRHPCSAARPEADRRKASGSGGRRPNARQLDPLPRTGQLRGQPLGRLVIAAAFGLAVPFSCRPGAQQAVRILEPAPSLNQVTVN